MYPLTKHSFSNSASPVFNEISSAEFKTQIHDLRNAAHKYAQNLTLMDDYEGYRCFTSDHDGFCGYALSKEANEHQEYELINVFSRVAGYGYHALTHAALQGVAMHINCFSPLRSFYEPFGFQITKRVPNWNAGKDDILYMSYTPNP